MTKSNLIKDKIINQIRSILVEKKHKSGVDILWFDNKIPVTAYNTKYGCNKLTIDSVSLFPNGMGGFGSILWEELDGQSLLEIKRRLSNEDFYFFKDYKIEGRFIRSKTRLKKIQ